MITLGLLVCMGSILMDGGLVVGQVGKPECKGRNFPGGGECCSGRFPGLPCTEGQGGCDSDVGCAGDLVCGRNNCGDIFGIRGASGSYDCCTKPNPAGKPKCKGRKFSFLTGKFSGGRECCKSEDPEESKCTEGQGDCDSDAGCKGDLVCGRNNCRDYISGASSSDDCCTTKRQPECTQTNSCRADGMPVGRCIGKSSNIPYGVKKTTFGRCNDGCQCVKFIKDCVQTDSCTANGGNCFPNIDLPFLPGLNVVDGDCEGGCICKKF